MLPVWCVICRLHEWQRINVFSMLHYISSYSYDSVTLSLFELVLNSYTYLREGLQWLRVCVCVWGGHYSVPRRELYFLTIENVQFQNFRGGHFIASGEGGCPLRPPPKFKIWLIREMYYRMWGRRVEASNFIDALMGVAN